MVKRKDNSIRADSGFKDAFIARKARNYEGLLNERKTRRWLQCTEMLLCAGLLHWLPMML